MIIPFIKLEFNDGDYDLIINIDGDLFSYYNVNKREYSNKNYFPQGNEKENKINMKSNFHPIIITFDIILYFLD